MKFIMFIPVGFLKMKPVINDFQKLIDKIFFNDIFIKTQNYIKNKNVLSIIQQGKYILNCWKGVHRVHTGKFPTPAVALHHNQTVCAGSYVLYVWHVLYNLRRVQPGWSPTKIPISSSLSAHCYIKTENILNKKLNFKETIKVKSFIKTVLTFISEEDLLHQISCTELSLL